ncbi:MAG: DUF4837 family protein [Bacteroidia bacterium]|nr:DUF4837 family protein [Bacteroidia bacterium]
MKKIVSIFIILASLTSCSDKKSENLPPAAGISGDMYLIMDSLQWKGPLGTTLDSIFNAEMRGLPRPEYTFNMHWIDPRKLNFILKQRRNLIFATTLDKRSHGASIVKTIFTPDFVKKIKSDPSLYITTSQNVFAKGQEVMYLFGNNEKELIANIRKNRQQLVDYFDKTERDRLSKSLFKSGQLKGLSDWIKQNMQADLQIPFGYKLVINEKDFVWVRQINPRDDKDVFIARKKYSSPDQFSKDSLIKFRDEICKKYLFEDPEVSNSYLITETTIPFVPIESRQVNFNKHFAIETRGLWRANNYSMGGPFVSYALVDEATGYFYYVEGFTFSPSRSQREIMRELETILYTFKTSDQLPVSNAN